MLGNRLVSVTCLSVFTLALLVAGTALLVADPGAPSETGGLRTIDDGVTRDEPVILVNPYGLAGAVPSVGPNPLTLSKAPGPICNCCSGGNGVGCDCQTCQDTVCAADPFCCNTAWDLTCDGEGATMCSCCASGCDQVRLEWGASCGASPYGLLVDYEIYKGAVAGFPAYTHDPLLCSTGGALTRDIGPGASDEYYLIVPTDAGPPHKVEGSYGRSTAGLRPPRATACLAQALGSCAEFNDPCNCCSGGNGVGGGCDCGPCQDIVCAADPFCCLTEWDGICDGEGATMCNCCTSGCNVGPCNCCSGGNGLGCDCPDCESTVCAADPFCCATSWDSICDGEGTTMCNCCTDGCLLPSEGDSGPTFETRESVAAAATAAPENVLNHHIRVVIDGSRPEELRQESQEALLTALNIGFDDLETGLKVADALVGNVDASLNGLLSVHLEEMRDEAEASGRGDLVRQVDELLNTLE